ncbi:hypothetical protein QBC36DRAFT_387489 [Triangularia setosa]|uniref:Uncharacterized protein n=1 Tax=Triangularia setosa TaxID=2587417 RepID=A0AAN6W744_9PEZI|nr:hypothetical protein QBC36DRAFT_387489 [Podospora setosa]
MVGESIPENGFQTPIGNKPENQPQNIVDSQFKTPTTSTGATPHLHAQAPYANAIFGTPSAIATPAFNRAVSVPGGPPSSFSSPFNQVPWPTQDIINVRTELLKALPFYKNIHATIESQPEVLSRLDVLHYLGINIHHPHIARPSGLGSLLAVWNQLARCSSKQIRDLKHGNTNLKNGINGLKKRVVDLEARSTLQPHQQGVGGAKEPTRFDGSESNKYSDRFKTEKDKICYILFFLGGDAFWEVTSAAEAIVNSDQGTDACVYKTGEQLLDYLTERYGKRD